MMKDGQISSVQPLKPDTDAGLIEQATKAFYERGGRSAADGFEVWDGQRFVFRFPASVVTGGGNADR
jgi:hypothetical protein